MIAETEHFQKIRSLQTDFNSAIDKNEKQVNLIYYVKTFHLSIFC